MEEITGATSRQQFTLAKETEFRFEVLEGDSVKLTVWRSFISISNVELISGFAECFGAELPKGKQYTFSNCSTYLVFSSVDLILSCIFSWQGCVLEVEGECKSYIGEQTPMGLYANVHCILQVCSCC